MSSRSIKLERHACLTVILVLLAGLPAAAETPQPAVPPAAKVAFNRDVRPILSDRCFKCHGPAVQEAGLRFDQPEAALVELESGQRAIVPGNAGASALVARVGAGDVAERMPPAEAGPPLSAAEQDILRRWIAQGAAYERHWAYLPPAQPAIPGVSDRSWPANQIDYFILSELDRSGLEPAGEASRATLIRRVALDLTGLPPTPQEVQRFVEDPAPDAYDRVVERLLASPQYGVRQALAWLDLARYADSDGYPHDGDRTMWPYRDWVVDAFNRDMPYDQFTLEQLAGDLLPQATVDQRLASAFHRQTRINKEAGVDPEEFRYEAVIDRVNTTATVWLGATLGCAQCHDHKYDPFTQRDYYRLLAYFNSGASETTVDEAGKITDVSPRMEWWPREMLARRTNVQRQLAAAGDAQRSAELSKTLDSMAPVKVLVMRELEMPRPTHVLARGSFLSPSQRVSPGTPAAIDALPQAAGGDRRALAQWLVDKRHPLTARVAVNRLWAQYFGTGLVETLDDLGTQAAACSHPQLLDWLATEWMRHDWHWKPLHRLIVHSATYRQASTVTPPALERDPQNRLLSRGARVRLPAELVRDAALAAGGLLNPHLGGPTVTSEARPNGFYRRSIYVRWKRQALDDMFSSFDAPSRDVTCALRTRTNTPVQALTLLNHRLFLDAARGLAEHALRVGGDDWSRQLDAAYLAVLSRPPTEQERGALSGLYERRRTALAADPRAAAALVRPSAVKTNEADALEAADDDLAARAAWVLVANTLLNLNEAITRE
ncbi:MAG: DUF1553 domain-containing protein [Pirellulales bacterium]